MANENQESRVILAPHFLMMLSVLEQKHHFDSTQFLKDNRISLSALKENSITLNMTHLKLLMDAMLQASKDYSFLYDIAKLTTPSGLGILGYIMVHSHTVYEALEKLCKYYVLIGKRLQPIISPCEEGYKIVVVLKSETGDMMDFQEYGALIHLFSILHLINHIIPSNITPIKIHLSHTPSIELKKPKVSDISLFFDEEENAIYFDKDIQSLPTTSANEHLLKVFEKEAEDALGINFSQDFMKDQVSSLILVSSSELDISLESIANKANVHPRVLQKSLKKEGTTFSKLLLEMRKKLSIYYLKKEMELHTIALNLGYFDLSSFFRAFKKWYGITPSEYKLRNIDGEH